MVAALYDQSLDAYLPHAWQAGFGVFRQDWSRMNEQFENMAKQLNRQGGWPLDQRNVQITYRRLPSSITVEPLGLRLRCGEVRKRTDDRARRRQTLGGIHSSYASSDERGQERQRRTGRCRRHVGRWRTGHRGIGEKVGRRKRRADGKAASRRWRSRSRPARPGAQLGPGRGTQEPQRNGLLLPPSALRLRRPREARIHHARGLDQVEVPRLRPRRAIARRAVERRSGHRQGPDGPAQSAAVLARRRRAGVHRQGQQPVGDAAERQGAAELQQCPHRQSDR